MKVVFTVMIHKESSSHRSGRAHNHQEKKRRGRSRVEQTACSLFFQREGIGHHEFVSHNTMVNSDFYYDVLRCTRENVQWRRPELLCNHNWLLHYDTAPAHTSLKTTEFMTNNMVMILRPPYLPGLAPCDFALFPKLKMKLKERRFETMSDIWR
jgi:hypothetical protein